MAEFTEAWIQQRREKGLPEDKQSQRAAAAERVAEAALTAALQQAEHAGEMPAGE